VVPLFLGKKLRCLPYRASTACLCMIISCRCRRGYRSRCPRRRQPTGLPPLHGRRVLHCDGCGDGDGALSGAGGWPGPCPFQVGCRGPQCLAAGSPGQLGQGSLRVGRFGRMPRRKGSARRLTRHTKAISISWEPRLVGDEELLVRSDVDARVWVWVPQNRAVCVIVVRRIFLCRRSSFDWHAQRRGIHKGRRIADRP
jgi:hypothetical protein